MKTAVVVLVLSAALAFLVTTNLYYIHCERINEYGGVCVKINRITGSIERISMTGGIGTLDPEGWKDAAQ